MESGVVERVNAFLSEVYGITPLDTKKLTLGFVNDSFLITTQDQGKYVFRVSRAKATDEVSFEVETLQKLEASQFISPHVVPNLNGEYSAIFESAVVVVFNYIEGDIAGGLSVPSLLQLGREVARMHVLLEGFCPAYKKNTWEPDALISLYKTGREELLKVDSLDTHAVVAFCDEYISEYGTDLRLPQGVTHQDIKRDNIIVNQETIVGIIDFDNAYYGTLLYDFLTAVMWEGYTNLQLSKERTSALLKGYQEIREFTAEEKNHFVYAFKARLVREVFIGPFAALQNKHAAMKRALEFIQKFRMFDSSQEEILLAGIIKD